MKVSQLCVTLWTPWTVAHWAPLSVEFSRQEYWKWVAISFSSGSSWPRDQTLVPCIAGRFFTIWATKTPLKKCPLSIPKLFSTSAHFSTGFAEKWVVQLSVLFLHPHFLLSLKYVIFKLHMRSLFFFSLSVLAAHSPPIPKCYWPRPYIPWTAFVLPFYILTHSLNHLNHLTWGIIEGVGARQHQDLFFFLFNLCLLRIYHVPGTTLKLKGK